MFSRAPIGLPSVARLTAGVARGSLALLPLLLLLASTPAQALERYPTSNRFGISIGFGFGSASLSSFHEAVDKIRDRNELLSLPKSGLQINAEIGFRYYFPYHLLAQVGCDAVYNRASAPLSGGLQTVSSHQLAMEVPILVGGYYPFLGRLLVFGAIGPSPFFYSRSWWDIDPLGSAPDYMADGGVGFHALGGAEFLVTRGLALGLELRYRYLKAKNLRGMGGIDPNIDGAGYDLDLSGISLGFTVRAFAF